MSPGRPITLWTARLSMALLAWSFVRLLRHDGGQHGQRHVRLIWTTACAVFVLHVAAAFEFIHHWSNASAVRATADQTRELIGVSVGGGLYASYVFLALWILDVIIWWSAPKWRERHRAIRTAFLGFVVLIAFNAAVIFATSPARWVGLLVTMALIWLLVARVVHRNPIRGRQLKLNGVS